MDLNLSSQIILFNTDTSGIEIWSKAISDSLISFWAEELIVSDSGYLIVGSKGFNDAMDVYLLKLDSLGISVWDKTYGGNKVDVGTSVALLSDGGFAITGSYGLTSGSQIYLVKTDNIGTSQWAKVFGDDYYNIGSSVIVKNETITVAGKSYDQSSLNPRHLYLAKTKLDGTILGMCETSQELSNASMPDIIQISNTDYIITGGTDSVFLFRTSGCASFSSIEEIENKSRVSVYPNPFTNVANVTIENLENEEFTFKMYNSLGQEVLYMKNIQGNSFTISAKNLPGGIYFYSLQSAKNMISGKVIIQ